MTLLKTKFMLLCFCSMAYANNTNLKTIREVSKDLGSGKVLQLEALEIRAKIHEPTLFYILDKPNFHIQFNDDDIQLSPKIPLPILRNEFE